ncbi:hypothetical protein ACJJTC_003579 [Scirpophaga incertulas]
MDIKPVPMDEIDNNMDINNQQNQNYWFVLRENNVYNFTIQNPPNPGQETRYIVDMVNNRQYIQINDAPVSVQDDTPVREIAKPKEQENFWDKNKVKFLLTLCLDHRFKNETKETILWDEIAILMGCNPDECHKKYRNLRKTYIRLLKKKQLGKHVKWIHFTICEEVFKDCNSLPPSLLETWDDTKIKRLLTLYIENLSKFRDPYYLQKDVWKEIAAALNTTEYNCYYKFKNLKRTYFNWLERNNETGKLIKWPYHNYFQKIFYNFKPAVGTWDRNKVNLLMQTYSQIAHKFNNPKFLKKELWKEISIIVGENPSNCDRKFRNLKQTYIRLKMRSDMGRALTNWCYYKDFEAIYNSIHSSEEIFGSNKEDNYVKQLLTYYLDNKDKFRNRLMKKKNLWKAIGLKLGLSAEECHRKFRNLKQTYIRLREKKISTGKCCKWPYYNLFDKIYDDIKIPETSDCHIDQTSIYEVKRAIRNFQRRDLDKFDRLVRVAEESNNIQRERNEILRALLHR